MTGDLADHQSHQITTSSSPPPLITSVARSKRSAVRALIEWSVSCEKKGQPVRVCLIRKRYSSSKHAASDDLQTSGTQELRRYKNTGRPAFVSFVSSLSPAKASFFLSPTTRPRRRLSCHIALASHGGYQRARTPTSRGRHTPQPLQPLPHQAHPWEGHHTRSFELLRP